jgi:putative nucleotidyltransferase with HDIG domain
VSAARTAPSRLLPAYVATVAVCGAAVLAHAAFGTARGGSAWWWLVAAGLAVAAGSFRLTFASVDANIAIDDAILIAIAILFGPGPATLAIAAGGATLSWRRGHPWTKVVFNTTSLAIAMWAAASVFFAAGRLVPLAADLDQVGRAVLPLLLLIATYFGLNSWLTAIVVALDTGQSAPHVWWRYFRWLWVNYLAAASVAFCLVLLLHERNIAALLLVLPIFGIFYLTLRTSFGRVNDARRHLAEVDRLYLSTVETLAMAIDAKDDVTHSHVRRVQAYAMALARAIGVDDKATLKAIEAAALLHDTGKLAIPDHILNKPGKLSAAEFEKMKLHADIGADILALVRFPFPVEPIVRCHHENWDGSGYPRGVAGDAIPIGARILSVVDCFDALTSDRPYRRRLADEDAVAILQERRGTMYDPRIVDAFISMYRDVAVEQEETPEQREVLQRISATRREDVPIAVAPTPEAMTHDLLSFVSLARIASGDHSLIDALGLASTLVGGMLPGVTGAWYVPDESADGLVVADTFGPHAAMLVGRTVGMGERLTGWVAAKRQPILDADAALDLGIGDAATLLRRCISVPLTVGDTTIAVLTLFAPGEGDLSPDRARLVQVVAPHLAVTVQSALARERAARKTVTAEPGRRTGTLALVSRGRS